ncbi:MAG: hypothetical protein IPO27_00290 [Bacteroidetes bacterium]|nr:hypothetical protein [Bacteroidota bacterium]
MKLKSLLTSIALFFAYVCFAQESATEAPKGYEYNNHFDFTLGVSSGQFSGALSWVHLHGLGKKKKFKIGYGVRFTGYSGSDLNYLTAPAKLTSGQTGPQVLFTEINPANYDTLFLSKAQVNALNAFINLQYSVSKKFDIGFNIDAVGISFGGSQTGKYMAEKRPLTMSETQEAKPTAFNALLISDNDLGTLNSELYVRYWIKNKIGIKAGLGFLFTEYTTTNKLVFDNDRWRNKTLMGMIGVTYTPFK